MNMMFKNSRIKVAVGVASAVAGVAFLISACSGGGTSADGSTAAAALTISGGFSGVTMQSLTQQKPGSIQTLAATDYTVICSMMVDPFTSGYSALDSSGAFTLSISGASGQPIGCMIVKAGKRVADFEFTAADTGMTGATGGNALSVNSGATAITLPTNLTISGASVAVPIADVTQDSTVAPTVTWADPTGTWNIIGACQTSLDATTGVPTTACNGTAAAGDIPTSVYLKQLEATNGASTKTGLSVWKDAAARTGCGDKEAVTLDGGWTATGGWAAAMTGGVSMDISDTTKLGLLTAKAKVMTHDNGMGAQTAVCGMTTKVGGAAIVSGTTLCSEVDWGTGGWGMGADACKLYCVMGALNSGGGTVSYFDWGTATCKKRYRVRWENNNELAADVNYGAAGTTAGVFAAGTCDDTSFDGCKDTGSGKILFEMEKAEDQYMIGELFISGNVGTLMQKNHFSNNFQNAAKDGVISCGGTRIEKLTMTQSSASTATIAVDNSFVADSSNAAECATNEFFANNSNEESSMVLKLQK